MHQLIGLAFNKNTIIDQLNNIGFTYTTCGIVTDLRTKTSPCIYDYEVTLHSAGEQTKVYFILDHLKYINRIEVRTIYT